MNKAYIQFSNKILESYLRKLFESPTGEIRISERNPVGVIISQLVKKTTTPPVMTDNAFCVIIPDAENVRHLKDFFLYFSKTDMETIEKVVQSYYQIELLMVIAVGYQMGLNRKLSILAFVDGFDEYLSGAINFEQAARFISRERRRARSILSGYLKKNNIVTAIHCSSSD